MGKRLIQQRRGKGTSVFKAKSFRYKGKVRHRAFTKELRNGKIIDLINCPGHSAPLAFIQYEDKETCLVPAPEGVKVGDAISSGAGAELSPGNSRALQNIPEGTLVYNIESRPGDGGRFCRSSGTFARVLARIRKKVLVQLPSKKQRLFDPLCRANIGIIAGDGRPEKPFYKAGRRFHAMKAKNRYYPQVKGTSMNAVAHPHGTSRSSKKGRPTIARRHAPPGAKVGMIRASRTGRRKK